MRRSVPHPPTRHARPIAARAAAGAVLATMMAAMIAQGAAAQGLTAPRRTLGIYDGWGAFRVERGGGARRGGAGAGSGSGGRVCYAIATPAATVGPRAGAFLSFATWTAPPRRGSIGAAARGATIARGQLYVRLSRAAARPGALRIVVGSVRVPLVTRGVHGWTSGPGDDARVRAGLRAATSLSVTGAGAGGRAIADTYRLAGAASALDAATLGCAA